MIKIWNKFNYILDKKQKIRVLFLVCLMIIGALLETIGVGLIPTIITFMMDMDSVFKNSLVQAVCHLFHISSSREFIIALIGGLIFVYIFKSIYMLFLYSIQYRFTYNNRFRTQRRLMEAYLYKPYEYYLQASSGEIVNQLTNNILNTFEILMGLLNFWTEGIIAVILIITVIIINPAMSIAIGITLAVLIFIIGKVIKPVMKKSGEEYQSGMILSNKWILQSIAGIKEIKTARREQVFLNKYLLYGKQATEALRKSKLLDNVPRIVIETTTMCVVLFFLLSMVLNGGDFTELLPQLAGFAVAGVKVIPGVNRMVTYRNQIAYSEPMLDSTIALLKEVESENQKRQSKDQNKGMTDVAISFHDNCRVSHITFTYPDGHQPVLKDVSMEIPVGSSVGIMGPSGAGKSTIVDIILGLLKPQKGEILVDGRNIEDNLNAWLDHIGYIPQMVYMLDDTIRRNVAFGYIDEDISDKEVWRALSEAELAEFIKELPDGLDTVIGERGIRLSGGQRQRIGIARALYANPDLLVFDEATSALDNETEADIIESLNSLHGKKTMIIIAHRLTTIANCDIVYKVDNQEIILERKREIH